MNWEYFLIAWLYVFGAASTAAAWAGEEHGKIGLGTFYIAALWPIALPILTLVAGAIDLFRKS